MNKVERRHDSFDSPILAFITGMVFIINALAYDAVEQGRPEAPIAIVIAATLDAFTAGGWLYLLNII